MMKFKTNTTQHRTVLITGATSGIGYQSVLKMLNLDLKIIIICRNEERVNTTILKLKSDSISDLQISKQINFRVADLSDLVSIELMADDLIKNEIIIDTIILNAGLQYTGARDVRLSMQGYELTFAVNHLSHQYLIQKLLPLILKSSAPRVVVTASEVHNPMLPGGRVGKAAGIGDLSGLKSLENFNMIDKSFEFNADKAYKDSKLCNVLFSRELFSRLAARQINIPVICWAPGLVIPRTKGGFFRYSRQYNTLGQLLFAFIARDLLHITEKTESAGGILMDISTNSEYSEFGFIYLSNKINLLSENSFEESIPSQEALDDSKARDLWDLTNKIIVNYSNLETI